jgi:hypothetical protein
MLCHLLAVENYLDFEFKFQICRNNKFKCLQDALYIANSWASFGPYFADDHTILFEDWDQYLQVQHASQAHSGFSAIWDLMNLISKALEIHTAEL